MAATRKELATAILDLQWLADHVECDTARQVVLNNVARLQAVQRDLENDTSVCASCGDPNRRPL